MVDNFIERIQDVGLNLSAHLSWVFNGQRELASLIDDEVDSDTTRYIYCTGYRAGFKRHRKLIENSEEEE